MSRHPSEIEKYVILDHLGSGQFGDVYLAHDRALDARKAIKVLGVPDPQLFMQQLEEAQILNKCKHKHIVEVNEANVFQVNGDLKVVIDMEYIEDGSLEAAIESGFLPPTNATRIVIDVLFALEHAHGQEVLHRDVKPANILLEGPVAKLSDFGLATALAHGQGGSPKGYTTHLPPEFFAAKETTPLTDVYATGITLYRSACNISDWRNAVFGIKDLDNAIKSGTLIKKLGYPPFLPAKLKRVITKSCHPDPTKRYQSAAEMRKALERLAPAVDWRLIGFGSWQGECRRTESIYEAWAEHGREEWRVIIRKNGRRVGRDCKSFLKQPQALTYLCQYVSNSSFS